MVYQKKGYLLNNMLNSLLLFYFKREKKGLFKKEPFKFKINFILFFLKSYKYLDIIYIFNKT